MALVFDLGLAAGAIAGLAVVVYGGNFAAELADGETAGEAWLDTRKLAAATIGAIGALFASGLVTTSQVVGMVANLLGTSPTALTNLVSIGLGWLSITGAIDLGPRLYVGASLAFLGLALLVTEAKKRGA